MSNTYFKFKQFIIHQEHCAMKVCTDACIQGAFTAQHLALHGHAVKRVLDIGAGTGLLSLMVAQQHAADITAVELDPGAALQSRENFASSPWAERLHLKEADIRTLPAEDQFDFIITNPPFYESALKSGDAKKDQAMHATNLSYAALLEVIAAHLSRAGAFSVLLPYVEFEQFKLLAERAGFHLRRVLRVRQSARHTAWFRAVGIFEWTPGAVLPEDLVIYDEQNVYTLPFIDLLKDYYFKL
ncbi:tRNA1(Val) (adenine(37)-N6)-methyltransferase [Chitinophaga sp. Cy-1792]|uniref:tRNA1(Val) (adenine(37)-N6)-methyltransferase n=1 Tax=Chitinophaga sp. Cy-1792 TaxID=2608339 RepID=UPI002107382D|nr:methyltransferase [Chitinophaga sp. Cy-1792]NIG54640.1 methyltransferase [Chitinophaga sp. Cy-1792]